MSEKIENLTKEQKSYFKKYVDEWIKIGLSTQPANRAEAERGIKIAYEKVSLPIPKKIVWCGSPMSMLLTHEILKNISDKKVNLDHMRESVLDSVRDSVGQSVGESVWGSVWESVWESVQDSVRDSVWESVWDSVRESVRDSVLDSVGGSVRGSVRESVWGYVRESVWGYVRDSVWGSVQDSVRESVLDSVQDSVRDSVQESVRDSVGWEIYDCGYGQYDAAWLGFYAYFSEAMGLKTQTNKLEGLWLITKNAGWFLPCKEICLISERPNILNLNNQGQLHSNKEAALQYPDGWGIYAIHGVRLREYIITKPNEITVEKIEKEENTEIRRVMIERYGISKYLLDSGAKEISRDIDNLGFPRVLYKKEISNDEPLVMVHVKNSTLEPDGSRNDYFLRVPPTMETPAQAIAWTFNEDKSYNPIIET